MGPDRVAVESSRPPAICTIGDLILDVIVLPDGLLAADADTSATIRLCAGGQAANVAAWASALGATSRLICARGSDLPSELAAAELARHGVQISGPLAGGRGGVVVSLRGVAADLDRSDIDRSWLQSCDVLHVSGYCLLRDRMAEAAFEAARHARRVTVDLASAPHIELVGARCFAERLEALEPDLVFATEAERAALPDLDATWVIKLGARGAKFPEGLYPARSVDVVDTTGAGDALAAGYLVDGPELAIEAAARSVGLIGAMPPHPARGDR
jgi:sugar/nucleoside kinase (ribokinase family)